ncbi:hypothetical protein [Streptomyces sp. NPDC000410]|uniref:hypothetical protein n=1 Tax=Streptomyces sp. NPDC000410 TaxID=3154254 RepID=UPI0033185227
MPLSVAIAIALQVLLAVTFLIIPIAAWIHGGAAQLAAEREMHRQGHPAAVLERHGIRFREKPWELALALSICAILTALGSLNLAASGTGRLLSWIIEPLVLVVVGFITAGQVFATQYTAAAFKRSDDDAVRNIDARAVIAAANSALPSWLRPVVLVRFPLATLGSVLVIILLSTPAAGAYFG